MKIVIQKFGGTSVASEDGRQHVIGKIKKALVAGRTPVVAVSAMGRKGSPYATDTLLGLTGQAGRPEMKRNMDLLLSCGELISAVVLADELTAEGLKAAVLTGAQAGIITDGNHNDARIIDLRPEGIKKHLEAGEVVIVTGFQGVTEDGEVTTLGRGGSDTTAAALGVALDAEAIEIYTDVEGIMTADPRIVPDAKILDSITYNELCNLAYLGAKVVHPRAVEMAMTKQIPLWVRSTFSEHRGTLVIGEEGEKSVEERLITGIAYLEHITQLTVEAKKADRADKELLNVFQTLAAQDISVDFINVYPHYAVFTIKDDDGAQALRLLEDLHLTCTKRENCCKVSVVGANITGVPGVMAKIMDALVSEDIEVLQTADSYTTIWCLVNGADKEKAIKALHHKFNLN